MNRKAVRADVPVCGTGTSEHRQVSREIVASRWSLRGIFLPLLFLSFAFGLTVYAFVIRETARSIPRDVYALRVGVSSTAGIEWLEHVTKVLLGMGIATPKNVLSRSRFTTLAISVEAGTDSEIPCRCAVAKRDGQLHRS